MAWEVHGGERWLDHSSIPSHLHDDDGNLHYSAPWRRAPWEHFGNTALIE